MIEQLTKDLVGTSSYHSTLDSKHKIFAKIQPLTLELRRCRFRHQDFFILLYLQIFALQGVNFF